MKEQKITPDFYRTLIDNVLRKQMQICSTWTQSESFYLELLKLQQQKGKKIEIIKAGPTSVTITIC